MGKCIQSVVMCKWSTLTSSFVVSREVVQVQQYFHWDTEYVILCRFENQEPQRHQTFLWYT